MLKASGSKTKDIAKLMGRQTSAICSRLRKMARGGGFEPPWDEPIGLAIQRNGQTMRPPHGVRDAAPVKEATATGATKTGRCCGA